MSKYYYDVYNTVDELAYDIKENINYTTGWYARKTIYQKDLIDNNSVIYKINNINGRLVKISRINELNIGDFILSSFSLTEYQAGKNQVYEHMLFPTNLNMTNYSHAIYPSTSIGALNVIKAVGLVATQIRVRNNDGSIAFEYNSGGSPKVHYVEANRKKFKTTFKESIIAEDGSYPDNGIMGNFYYVKGERYNNAPTISGYDYDYKSLVDDFEIEYLITDVDTGDKVKVDVTLGLEGSLGEIIKSHESITLGVKYKLNIPVKSLPIGNYVIKIEATDKESDKSTRTYYFQRVNSVPNIHSDNPERLGGVNTGFTLKYQVNDDNKDDKLNVTVRINRTVVDQKSNVKHNEDITFTLTKEQLLKYELNKENTIEIEVVDDKGASNRLLFYFTRINSLPIISGNDIDLGEFTTIPKFEFSISDIEKDKIYYALYLDEKMLVDFGDKEISDGEIVNYELTKLDWLKLDPQKTHTFKIIATDQHAIDISQEQGEDIQTIQRVLSFKRLCKRLEVNFKIAESIEKVDGMGLTEPTQLIGRVTAMTLTPDLYLAGGAVVKYLVCNNGYDENPTWEDATNSVLAGTKYFFTNEVKTAKKWLYMIKIKVDRETAVENSRLKAVAGSWGYNDYNIGG